MAQAVTPRTFERARRGAQPRPLCLLQSSDAPALVAKPLLSIARQRQPVGRASIGLSRAARRRAIPCKGPLPLPALAANMLK